MARTHRSRSTGDEIAEVVSRADAELDALRLGQGISDGFLGVRRTTGGFVVSDREAEEPVERPADRAEALGFLVAIRGAQPRLALVSG